eukprot:scaffold3874_cov153-Pinguiococcus_pyrenoidosus.AAC.1
MGRVEQLQFKHGVSALQAWFTTLVTRDIEDVDVSSPPACRVYASADTTLSTVATTLPRKSVRTWCTGLDSMTFHCPLTMGCLRSGPHQDLVDLRVASCGTAQEGWCCRPQPRRRCSCYFRYSVSSWTHPSFPNAWGQDLDRASLFRDGLCQHAHDGVLWAFGVSYADAVAHLLDLVPDCGGALSFVGWTSEAFARVSAGFVRWSGP